MLSCNPQSIWPITTIMRGCTVLDWQPLPHPVTMYTLVGGAMDGSTCEQATFKKGLYILFLGWRMVPLCKLYYHVCILYIQWRWVLLQWHTNGAIATSQWIHLLDNTVNCWADLQLWYVPDVVSTCIPGGLGIWRASMVISYAWAKLPTCSDFNIIAHLLYTAVYLTLHHASQENQAVIY